MIISLLSTLLLPSITSSSSYSSSHEKIDHSNLHFYPKDQCTALAIGPKAMIDGSTIATHNNDCQECDIRITHVPAKDWPKGSKRPVFGERAAYPRFLQTPETNIHGPSYLVGTEDSTIYPWQAQDPIFYIDQVILLSTSTLISFISLLYLFINFIYFILLIQYK